MAENENVLYAAIMLKGTVKISRKIVDTLEGLRLSTPNSCVVIPSDSVHKGMLKRIAEFVTWGEINEQTLEKLIEKRGGVNAKEVKTITKTVIKDGSFKNTSIKGTFRLSPPKGGLKSVRISRPRGDIGYRGDDINNLLSRMI